jgi:hypothetical protein
MKSKLIWQDNRWHCDGEGIHAGEGMELRGDDGQWFRVRIESADRGHVLIAYLTVHGHEFSRRIDPEYDQLRWPK